MATKITRNIIESYLNCKYKGHLKLDGQQGTRSDYELLLAESRETVSRQAIDKILARHPEQEVEQGVVLSPTALKRGTAFLLNAILEDEHVSLVFDGLKQMSGPSKLASISTVRSSPTIFRAGASGQAKRMNRSLLQNQGMAVGRSASREATRKGLCERLCSVHIASGVWVVDGTLSASGKPLLASDSHRAIALPAPGRMRFATPFKAGLY